MSNVAITGQVQGLLNLLDSFEPISCSAQLFNIDADKFSGIYIITNRQNGDCYIGRSNDIFRRFSEHKAKRNTANTDLGKAFRRFGIGWFDFDLLEIVDCLNDILEREKYWISHLDPKYNMNNGGSGNSRKVDDKTKEVLSLKNKEYWKNLPESKKQKIIKRLVGPKKGHKVSNSTREKLRQANLGKKQSQQTIEKRSARLKGKKRENLHAFKKVSALKNGVVIEEFNSVKEAAEYFETHPSNISKALKGKQKTAVKFNWKYNK